MTEYNPGCAVRSSVSPSLKSAWALLRKTLLTSLVTTTVIQSAYAGLRDSETLRIADEGYAYGFPILLMDESRDALTGVNRSCDLGTDINTFHHVYNIPGPDFRAVVRPNVDTLYSSAMLDLTDSPMLLDMPAVADRYVLMALLDAWSNNFAGLGTQSHGSDAGKYFITGPDFTGTTPEGYKRIPSPTNLVWVIGRTEVDFNEDLTEINQLQNLFAIDQYRSKGPGRVPEIDCVDRAEPEEVIKGLSGEEFFTRLDTLMREHPLAGQDEDMIEKLAKINVGPLATGKVKSLSVKQKADLKAGMDKSQERLDKAIGTLGRSSAWTPAPDLVPLGDFDEDYFIRAVVAQVGFGANRGEFAVYQNVSRDTDGEPLNGNWTYTLTFPPGQVPDVGAFWSVTVYNLEGFLTDNVSAQSMGLNRYAVGSNTGMQFEDDGSLVIHMASTPTEGMPLTNWLPIPGGDFELTLRLYDPSDEILEGDWVAPEVVRSGAAY